VKGVLVAAAVVLATSSSDLFTSTLIGRKLLKIGRCCVIITWLTLSLWIIVWLQVWLKSC